ncbi:hypothetical protein COL8621_00290 [Actibacterium lipolyticum]|uniref:Uncharacterized protein n=1 Tax=Actibacterium lipolyticum TaxID=1524263 RepID=A0A238JLQ4_9RHOB|nr:hypothetical protein COL8621_00290 [Actibacterium lipolyticum]
MMLHLGANTFGGEWAIGPEGADSPLPHLETAAQTDKMPTRAKESKNGKL